jgi:hypothetical protein
MALAQAQVCRPSLLDLGFPEPPVTASLPLLSETEFDDSVDKDQGDARKSWFRAAAEFLAGSIGPVSWQDLMGARPLDPPCTSPDVPEVRFSLARNPVAGARLLVKYVSAELLTAPKATALLFPYLLDPPSSSARPLREALVRFASPGDVLDAGLQGYAREGSESWLLVCAALLRHYGTAAWGTLRTLSFDRRSHVEPFVRLIADCPGVSHQARVEALRSLAAHPSGDVRRAVLDALDSFETASAVGIYEALKDDSDRQIREVAQDKLHLDGGKG